MQDPTVRNITFATPAPDEPAHEQTNKEIKLWDRSAVPLGTRTSVSHADYRQMPIEPPPPSQRLGYTPNPHKLDARTTTQDAYQAWAPQAPPSPSMGPGYTPSKHKFNGTSVSHDDYRQMPIEPPPPSQRLSYTPNPHKLDGVTTTQDAYRAITVPQGSQALGVRTQGGGFHPLIPAGSTLPAIGSAVFTTTSRNQSEVAIKIIALVGGHPELVGSFELAGVLPALAGVPQIVVTFELDSSYVLHVTADDRTREGARATIVIRDRLPTPPRERPS